jgi:hypothetical protein
MELLKVSVGVLWLINLVLLIWHMAAEEVNGWNITALIGVALTGVIPMLFRRKDNAKREGCAAFLYVISGVIGAAGSGLALGYAAQCGKSYDNIELLIAAAIVNGLSGIVAHYAFINKEERDGIYKNRALAYHLLGDEWVIQSRPIWGIIVGVISGIIWLLTSGWIENDAYKTRGVGCDNKDHYTLYYISPIVHVTGTLVLFLANSFDVLHHITLMVVHVAAIVSMFGLTLTRGWGGDWLIVGAVYVYLALAHLTVKSRKVAARRVRTSNLPELS